MSIITRTTGECFIVRAPSGVIHMIERINELCEQVADGDQTSITLLPFYRTHFGHRHVHHNRVKDTFSICGEEQDMRRVSPYDPMNISSSIHVDETGGPLYMVLDVCFDGKHLFVAVVQGKLWSNPPTTTELGEQCMHRLAAVQSNAIHKVQVHGATLAAVESLIHAVFDAALPLDAIAFVCADEDKMLTTIKALRLR